MNTWYVYDENGRYHVMLVGEGGAVLRTHPIPFTDRRDAVRAAARLNVRDGSE
jgi:hypothetical protein